jgi:hypothetical protein
VAGSFITVTVAPGDTVWSLANRLAAGSDVRSLVSEIISVNSLQSMSKQGRSCASRSSKTFGRL